MKLNLNPLEQSVYVGDKLAVQTKFTFDEEEELYWSGIILLTSPPCSRELQIARKEIFTKGIFEAGEYIRQKAMTIKNNVVPTIEKRDLVYDLELLLRKPNPINPDEHLIIKRKKEIEILPKKSADQKSPNPLSFSISNLNINVKKDVFKPGETIKINYTSEGLRELEVRLLQKANLVCHCEEYGSSCQQVEDLPPAIAGNARKKTNTKEGYLLIKVPETAEPTHNYLWEPSEKEFWGLKYGDYCEWSLLIIGRKDPEYGKEPIRFELPITITAKPIEERKSGVELFSESKSEASNLFEGVPTQFQKQFKVVSTDLLSESELDLKKYKIEIENISKKTLEGATIKLSGLQEGLFETAPSITGFNKWKKGEVKDIYYETKQPITALISVIEDNSQMIVRTQFSA
jgi:hypothetical protein